MAVYDDIMRPGVPIPAELIEQYGAEFDALAARHGRLVSTSQRPSTWRREIDERRKVWE